jgi:glutamate racemase
MPNATVVFIHTVPPLIEVFSRLAGKLLPGVRVMHILDEPLLEHVRRQGQLSAADVERLATHIQEAAAVGAEAALVTCSTVSPAVDAVRGGAAIPVIKIDEAMIDEAVRLGAHVGVVATNPTTLTPTQQLLCAAAQRVGKEIAIEPLLVEGALAALLGGDGATHDCLVRDAVESLAERVDVVVLAQASMARVMGADGRPQSGRRCSPAHIWHWSSWRSY